MLDLLILFFLNSFFIVGFHITTQEGEINHWVDNWLHNLPEWVKKQLYSCPTCMSSVHSVYIYWTYHCWHHQINWHTVLIYIVYVFGLACVNTLINLMIEYYRSNIKQADYWDKSIKE